jgi:biopolymer transport protein TolR
MAFTTSNGRTQTSLSDINVTPFVDVVLVLLIIFMVTAPVMQSGIEVDVPQTKSVQHLDNDRIVITITAKQALYVGKDPVKIHDLGSHLRSVTRDPAGQDVYVRCDKSVPFNIYAQVIDELRQSKITKINFVTKPYVAGQE